MSDRGPAVYELLRHAREVVLTSARVVEGAVRELGWTVGSRAVVEVLSGSGPVTVPQIAAQLSLARQNVQRHVDDLVRLGHARTRPNPAHRRSVLIELTPVGQETFDRLHARELADLGSLAGSCSDGELAGALKVLTVLDHDIRARAPRAGRTP